MAASQALMHVVKPYLNVPVRNGGDVRKVRLYDAAGVVVRYFDVAFAEDGEPDYWAFTNMSEFLGAALTVAVEGDDSGAAVALFRQTDMPLGLEGAYEEEYRPQFHFSARRGWTNDPNGLVHYDGTWHLFFQHSPFGRHSPFDQTWGGMQWGHAVSRDLLHWTECDAAVLPDLRGMVYSGSAVVDWHNTSGLQSGRHPPLVLFHTAAGHRALTPVPCVQCLSYSLDGGKTFRKHPANPVVPSITPFNRDPKVIWHAPTRRWAMVLYLDKPGDVQRFAILTSDNLLTWTQTQEVLLPGSGECPELFELPVGGDPSQRAWVFMAADGAYRAGTFDGREFTSGEGPYRSFFRAPGRSDIYAPQTWNDAPDGRRILIGWQQGDIPARRFNMCMTFPVELSLRRFSDGIRLCAAPVREIARLCRRESVIENVTLPSGSALDAALDAAKAELLDIEVDMTLAAPVVLDINGVSVTFDPDAHTIGCEGGVAQTVHRDGRFTTRILADRTSLEIFSDGGRLWMARRALASPSARTLRFAGGQGTIRRMVVRELASIWRSGARR